MIRRHLASRRQLLLAAGTSTVGSLISAGVAMVVNILMSRQLGPDARGEVAWVLQAAYMAAPFMALGVDRLGLRHQAGPAHVAQIHVWLLVLPAAAIGSTLGLNGWACALAGAVSAVMTIERAVAIGSGRLNRFLLVLLAIQGWTLVAALILYFGGLARIELWLAIYVAPAAALLARWLVEMRKKRQPFAISALLASSPAGWGSSRLMLGSVSAIWTSRFERLALPLLASPRQLGIYVSVATASEMLTWVTQGFSDGRVTGLARRRISKGQMLRWTFRDIAIFALLGSILGGAINWMLLPLLGAEFAQARHLILPLIISAVAWAVYRQLMAVWLGRGAATSSSVLDIVGAIVATAAALIAIPGRGAVGAAWGCAVAYSFMIVIAVLFWSDPGTE